MKVRNGRNRRASGVVETMCGVAALLYTIGVLAKVWNGGAARVLLLGGWLLLVTSTAHAAMGYDTGVRSYSTPEEGWGSSLEKFQCPCLSCVQESGPDGPTAAFSVSVNSGRFPLMNVAFQDLSTPGQGELGNIVCRYWAFGNGNEECSPPGGPSAQDYEHFGVYTVKLIVVDAAGRCSSTVDYVIAELTVPSETDCDHLAALENLTGMREMIERHPTRHDFLLGTAEFDGLWFGQPLQRAPLPCDPCGDETVWTERHWDDCREGHVYEGVDCYNTCAYCRDDPKRPDDRALVYGTIPLRTPVITDYLNHDFNMLWTANSMVQRAVARKAVWNAQHTEVSVSYCFDFLDYDFVEPAQAMNMRMCASLPVYWLAAWPAYGAAMGWLAPEGIRDILEDYVTAVMRYFTEPQGPRFAYWTIAAEVLKNMPLGSGEDTLAEMILWDRPFQRQPTGEVEIHPRLWWPWYLLTKPARTGQAPPYGWGNATDIEFAADSLKDFYTLARELDPEAMLTYSDYGMDFRYGERPTGQPEGWDWPEPLDQRKYVRAQTLVDEFQAEDIPLDAIAMQMHLTTWSCLTYHVNEDVLRLNPKQLVSIRDGIRGFEEKGLKVIFSEMDVRMGIPYPRLYDGLGNHFGDDYVAEWRDLSVTERSDWQGKVYEAVLNAALVVPALGGVSFWDICDETTWLNSSPTNLFPYTPLLPSEGASSPCLFGDDPDTPAEREMYYPKPAYWGVRTAITNYFGKAVTLRDGAGRELARFVENGNVLLMKPEARVVQEVSNWVERGLPSPTGHEFVLRNRIGGIAAVITEDGVMYLTGHVMENEQAPIEPAPWDAQNAGKAFTVRFDNDVVSLIDEHGNLKLKGYLLEDGIPFALPKDDPDDKYFRG